VQFIFLCLLRGFVHFAGIKESTVDIGEELHEEAGIGE
jgi:hypothetical protein